MRNILKMFSITVAATTLFACGGGSSEAEHVLNIDSYVGIWKSPCYPYRATNGISYYSIRTATLTKVSVTELAIDSKDENAYSDAACSKLVSNFVTYYYPAMLVFDRKYTIFAGKTVDTMLYVDLVNGEVFNGFMTVDKGQLYIATYATGQAISGWGVLSPFTKQ